MKVKWMAVIAGWGIMVAIAVGMAILLSEDAKGSAAKRTVPVKDIDDNREAGVSTKASQSVAEPIDAKSNKKVQKRVWVEEDPDDPEYPYSKEDKALAKELQDVLDDVSAFSDEKSDAAADARRKLYMIAEKACKSSNPSVRERGVEALSWEGGDALAELTPMMADPVERVAEAAIGAVEQALEEQRDPNLRFEAAAAYMGTFSVNENALTMLGGTLASAALEIIEPRSDSAVAVQTAFENRVLVVDALANMIETGSSASAEAAKEAFNDITGSDWISRTEGEAWAKDPDNYEPPENQGESESL